MITEYALFSLKTDLTSDAPCQYNRYGILWALLYNVCASAILIDLVYVI